MLKMLLTKTYWKFSDMMGVKMWKPVLVNYRVVTVHQCSADLTSFHGCSSLPESYSFIWGSHLRHHRAMQLFYNNYMSGLKFEKRSKLTVLFITQFNPITWATEIFEQILVVSHTWFANPNENPIHKAEWLMFSDGGHCFDVTTKIKLASY